MPVAFKVDETLPTVTCQSPAPTFALHQSGVTVAATLSDQTSRPRRAEPRLAADGGHDKRGREERQLRRHRHRRQREPSRAGRPAPNCFAYDATADTFSSNLMTAKTLNGSYTITATVTKAATVLNTKSVTITIKRPY
jgi:hypothetical protein